MKRAKRTIVILSLALAGCRGPIVTPTATPEIITVRILATTTTQVLLQDLAASYSAPDVRLLLDADTGNWQSIYNRLLAGEAPFALTAFLPAGASLWAAPIAQDGLAIIVGAGTGIDTLTLGDLKRIFQGQITSWAEVGGADHPITVFSREEGADTHHIFHSLVMHSSRVTLAARLALSSRSMIEMVTATPGAVGYASMAQLGPDARPVALADNDKTPAVLPTPQTVSDGRYPLPMPILITGPRAPAPETVYYDWFAWMQSEAGQQVVGRRYGRIAIDEWLTAVP